MRRTGAGVRRTTVGHFPYASDSDRVRRILSTGAIVSTSPAHNGEALSLCVRLGPGPAHNNCAGCWVLGAGCWVLGAGCWVLDGRCGELAANQRGGTTRPRVVPPAGSATRPPGVVLKSVHETASKTGLKHLNRSRGLRQLLRFSGKRKLATRLRSPCGP